MPLLGPTVLVLVALWAYRRESDALPRADAAPIVVLTLLLVFIAARFGGFSLGVMTAAILLTFSRLPGMPAWGSLTLLSFVAASIFVSLMSARVPHRISQAESEAETLRSLVQSVADGVLRVDGAGIVVGSNPSAERLLGFAPGTLVGQGLTRLLPDAFPTVAAGETFVRPPLGPSVPRLETIGRRRDGSTVPLVIHLVSDGSDNGSGLTCVLGELRAINVAESANDLHSDLAGYFARVSQNIPGAFYTYRLAPDGKGTIPGTFPAIKQILGFSREELATDASPFFARIEADERERLAESIADSAESLAPWHEVCRFIQDDGSLHWYEGWSVPERVPDGSTLWHGFGMEVTTFREAEQARTDLERFATSVLDSFSDQIAVLDEAATIVAVNRSWRQYGIENGACGNNAEGTNYLEICDQAKGDDRAWARLFASGLREVMSGERSSFSLEYPCHTPRETRWFVGQAHAFSGDGPRRVIVSHHEVSRYHKAEAALRAERDFSRSVLDSTSAIICRVDEDGTALYINSAGERITGYPRHEILGRNWWDTMYPGELRPQVDRLLEILKTDNPRDYEMTIATRSGERRVIAWSRDFRRDEVTDRKSIIGFGIDITERKAAEQALRESEERIAFATEAAGLGTWDWDVSTNIARWSSKQEELFGLAPGEFNNTREIYAARVHPDDLPGNEASVALALESHAPFRSEFRVIRPDGSVRWLAGSGRFLYDESGRPLRLAGITEDITDKKLAEQRLSESERRFRDVFETAPVSIWIEDWSGVSSAIAALRSDGVADFAKFFEGHPEVVREMLRAVRVLDVNRWTVHLFGATSREEILGSFRSYIATPDQLPGFVAGLTAFAEGRPSLLTETTAQKLDGDPLQVILGMSFPSGETGAGQVIVSLVDITERSRAVNRLSTQAALSRVLAEARSFEEAIPLILETLCRSERWDYAAAWMVDEPSQTLRCVGDWQCPGLEAGDLSVATRAFEFHPGEGLPGTVWAQKRPVIFPDVSVEPTYLQAPFARAVGLRCAVGFPIWQKGEVRGVIEGLTRRSPRHDNHLDALFESLGRKLGIFLDRTTAQKALRDSEEFSRQVILGVDEGLVVFDLSLRYRLWNRAIEEMTGISAADVLGKHPNEVRPELRQQGIVSMIERSLKGEAVVSPDTEASPPLATRNLWVSRHSVPLRNAEGEIIGVIGVVQDITERKRAELALRESTLRLENLRKIDHAIRTAGSPREVAEASLLGMANVVPCLVTVVYHHDMDANTIEVLAATGPLTELYPGGSRISIDPPTMPMLIECQTGRILYVPDVDTLDLEARPHIRALRGVGVRSLINIPMFDEQGVIAVVMLGSDVTDAFPPERVEIVTEVANHLGVALRRAYLFEENQTGKERLTTLTRRLINAEEQERRRIARELHDEIGQALTAVKINLEEVRAGGDVPERLEDSIDTVSKTLEQVRGIALDLRPSMLDDLGLVAALEWYVSLQSRRTGLAGHFLADPVEIDVDPEIATVCFRVAQEALTNIARHAQASRFYVEILQHASGVQLVVRDDGIGFDTDQRQDSSIGLSGIRERVGLVGGRVVFVSKPGEGTEVQVELPNTPAVTRLSPEV